MTNTNTKTKTMTMTNTSGEHLQRDPRDLWDLRHWLQFGQLRTWFMTIFVTWQLRVTLDSIRNSCDVFGCMGTSWYQNLGLVGNPLTSAVPGLFWAFRWLVGGLAAEKEAGGAARQTGKWGLLLRFYERIPLHKVRRGLLTLGNIKKTAWNFYEPD